MSYLDVESLILRVSIGGYRWEEVPIRTFAGTEAGSDLILRAIDSTAARRDYRPAETPDLLSDFLGLYTFNRPIDPDAALGFANRYGRLGAAPRNLEEGISQWQGELQHLSECHRLIEDIEGDNLISFERLRERFRWFRGRTLYTSLPPGDGNYDQEWRSAKIERIDTVVDVSASGNQSPVEYAKAVLRNYVTSGLTRRVEAVADWHLVEKKSRVLVPQLRPTRLIGFLWLLMAIQVEKIQGYRGGACEYCGRPMVMKRSTKKRHNACRVRASRTSNTRS